MSVTIIVKKDGSKPISKHGRIGFTPHWNTAIARNPIFISSVKQFDKELKSRGLELAESGGEHRLPRKDYKASKETHKLIEQIKRYSDKKGSFNPSGTLKETIRSKGILKTKEEMKSMENKVPKNYKEGGFYAPD